MLVVGLMSSALTAQAELKLDDVVNDYIEARGGMEVIKGMESMKASGKMLMGPMEAPFEFTYKAPNKIYTTFELQGMTGIQAFDGETGWAVMPFMGKPDPEVMADDQLKMTKDQANDIEGVLVDYKEKGHQVELVGTTEIEGTPVIELKVTKKNGDVVEIFLDEEYKLEVMMRAKTNMMGQEVEMETYFSDYKEVGDTVMAHSIAMKINGSALQNLSFEKVDVNLDVKDDLFTMPAAEKKEAAATTE